MGNKKKDPRVVEELPFDEWDPGDVPDLDELEYLLDDEGGELDPDEFDLIRTMNLNPDQLLENPPE